MEVEQGLFSLSTCLIDHKGRLRVLRKQICNHLLGFAGIWQWHVIHVCVWIEARRPEHLLQHRTESQDLGKKHNIFMEKISKAPMPYLWRLNFRCFACFILYTSVLLLCAGLPSLRRSTFQT